MFLQVNESGQRGRSRSPSDRRRDTPGVSFARNRSPRPVETTPRYPDHPGDGACLSAAYDYERLAWTAPPAFPHHQAWVEDGIEDEARVRLGGEEWREREHRTYEQDRDGEQEDWDGQRGRLQFLPQKYAIKTAEPLSPRHRDLDSDGERIGDSDRRRTSLLQFLPQSLAPKTSDSERERKQRRNNKYEKDLAYGKWSPSPGKEIGSSTVRSASFAYAQPKQRHYVKPDERWTYSREGMREARYGGASFDPAQSGSSFRWPSPGQSRNDSGESSHRRESSFSASAAFDVSRAPAIVTVEPRKSAMKRNSSPQPPTAHMATLSVQTTDLPRASLSAPGSPLLEPYHGTYQSISPMPSPLLFPTLDVPGPISPSASDDERLGGCDKKRIRRARFYDPVDDASRLAKALKGERRAPDTESLVEILPGLTHNQVMELRAEYKRLVKTGSDRHRRKGVNLAKHIRARLKDEDPALMKACYATALGRWESEAYWANFWYQGDKTRRELLIEALMGRTDEELDLISRSFKDKKYHDSLVRCLRTELKEDRFKKAVLMALGEQDGRGKMRDGVRVDSELARRDARDLNHAVKSERGGETLMLTVVVSSSDAHLREVLRVYHDLYGSNFARDALKKSGNLVGEILAHILNGVINKPVRDAMLVHHALTASRRDQLRRELLTSRLVRIHWDRKHMAAVKAGYRARYGREMAEAVRETTSGTGEWGDFMEALCIERMPDEVKRVKSFGG